MFYNVVQTSSEISPSLRLLLKVCAWYRCQNRIEKYYHHDGEQLTFYQRVPHIKTLAEKRRMFLQSLYCDKFQFTWQKLYSKQSQMPPRQREGSLLRWIVIEQVNYK